MSNSSTSIKKSYRNVIVLAVGTLSVALGLGMTNQVLFPYLHNVYGTMEASLGFGLPLFGVAYLIVEFALVPILLPVMGWISDRSGRKKIIVLAFFLNSFVAFLYPTILVAPLIFYYLISGFISSAYSPAYDALIADNVRTHRRGTTFGTITGALSLAALVGPIVATAILYQWNFSGVFYSSAVISLAGAVLCLLFLVEPPQARSNREIQVRVSGSRKVNMRFEDLEQANDQKEAKNPDSTPGLAMSDRWIVIISLIIVSLFLSFMSSSVRLMFYFIVGIPSLSGGQSWLSLLAVFSLILGGVLADVLGRKKTLLVVLEVGIGLSLVSSLILLIGQYLWSLIALTSIAIFVSSVSGSVFLALIADITPAKQRGLTYGLVSLGISIGQFVQTILVNVFLPPLYLLSELPVVFALTLASTIVAMILVRAGVKEPETAY